MEGQDTVFPRETDSPTVFVTDSATDSGQGVKALIELYKEHLIEMYYAYWLLIKFIFQTKTRWENDRTTN